MRAYDKSWKPVHTSSSWPVYLCSSCLWMRHSQTLWCLPFSPKSPGEIPPRCSSHLSDSGEPSAGHSYHWLRIDLKTWPKDKLLCTKPDNLTTESCSLNYDNEDSVSVSHSELVSFFMFWCRYWCRPSSFMTSPLPAASNSLLMSNLLQSLSSLLSFEPWISLQIKKSCLQFWSQQGLFLWSFAANTSKSSGTAVFYVCSSTVAVY